MGLAYGGKRVRLVKGGDAEATSKNPPPKRKKKVRKDGGRVVWARREGRGMAEFRRGNC